MAATSATRARKQPAQARSRAMVEAILDAAARILVKDGYEAFSTNRVAEAAGASVGSLYQYFPNKSALLAELMRRHAQDIMSRMFAAAEAAASGSLEATVRAMVNANIEGHLIDPPLHHVLSEEVPRLGELDWRSAFQRQGVEQVRALLERHRDEIVVADLDLAAFLLANAVDSVVHVAVGERADHLADGALADELCRMIVCYLLAGPRQAPRSISP